MEPVALEILEEQPAPQDGFLRVQRFLLRHRYADGRLSPPYPCDVVSRPGVDAVAAVIWFREAGRVRVVLKAGVRPPVFLRRRKKLIQPDPKAPLVLTELVAGLLEPGDEGPEGLARRASLEAREEAGLEIPPEAFRPLGAPVFPSPGAADEKVFLLEAELPSPPGDLAAGGDGSPMEEGTRVRLMDLEEAVRACRAGAIPDMKTELALVRLRDRLAAGG